MGYGLLKAEHKTLSDAEIWDKICIIDTENASGSLYVQKDVAQIRIGEYNTIILTPPYTAQSYIDAIRVAENANMEVIIIDSLTHAWSGEGGALDKQAKIAARSGNSYTAWREITPEHNRLVDTMLQSNAHIIADIRAKTDYEQTKDDRGKTVVKNVGLAPVFRDGIEYEFTLCLMLDADHIANATKDRTSMFDGQYFTITPDTGKQLYAWLADGGAARAPEPVKPSAVVQKATPAPSVQDDLPDMMPTDDLVTVEMVNAVISPKVSGVSKEQKQAIVEEVKKITGGTANYAKITDQTILRNLYERFKD